MRTPPSENTHSNQKGTTSQIEHEKPKIVFNDIEQGRVSILDESMEPYFELLQPLEIAATTGVLTKGDTLDEVRDEARNLFSSHVMSFSPKEKEAIQFYIEGTHEILLNYYPLITQIPWSFIKIDDHLCSGMAHTRGPHIVLSERHLKRIVGLRTKQDGKHENLGGGFEVLLHEKIHVLQRMHPHLWGSLYEDKWNFVRADEILSTDWLLERQVTNPDAILTNWVMPLVQETGEERFIWPRTIFGRVEKTEGIIPKMPDDFSAVAIELNKTGKRTFEVESNSLGVPKQKPLEEEKDYQARFPSGLAWDHPHEISAYALSKAIISKHFISDEEEPLNRDTTPFFTSLLDWAQKNLHP